MPSRRSCWCRALRAAAGFRWPSRSGDIRWYSPDPRGIIPLDTSTCPRRLARAVRQQRFEIAIDTELPRRDARVRGSRPRRRTAGPGSTRRSSRATARCTSAASRTRSRPGRTACWSAGSTAWRCGGAFFGESMFHRVDRCVEGRAGRAGRAAARRAASCCSTRSGSTDAPGAVRRDRDPAAGATCERLDERCSWTSRSAASGRDVQSTSVSVDGVGLAERERRDLRVELLAARPATIW